jgi:hypothetical protein
MLFKKDYFQLTKKEIDGIERAENFMKRSMRKNNSINPGQLKKYYELLPIAGLHSRSLFPNNYIFFNYEKHTDLLEKHKLFKELINDKSTLELDVLKYIKETESYYILESLFRYFDFGHHEGSFLFREFPLSVNYKCDFLLIGKSSGGYEFVFIEFEHPNYKSILKSGSPAESFRKGIEQATDWRIWLESNFSSLRNTFHQFKNPELSLPTEFYELDTSRLHFIVIAGRRGDFKEKTYSLRRRKRKEVLLLHYDNLLDACEFYFEHTCRIY